MADSSEINNVYQRLQEETSTVLVGQDDIIERLFISLLTEGHVLLEGVPGVAKTTIAKTFARAVGLDQSRIQLTPDTLPADVTGTTIYREQTGEFETQKGPVFANLVIADEVNRTTPKTQSALLEAMQERQVTIDNTQHQLPDPFMVVATQNPIEMEGTFELPEAQRDRFQFKLIVDLPDRQDERSILSRFDRDPTLDPAAVSQVLSTDDINSLQQTVAQTYVATSVQDYILDIVTATRQHRAVQNGASPRAALHYQSTSKAKAAIEGRNYVIPDDIKSLAHSVLAHRLVLSTEATLSEQSRRDIIDDILSSVDAPDGSEIREQYGDGSPVDVTVKE